jgi:tetratricopeptide (TPR) repeat protein
MARHATDPDPPPAHTSPIVFQAGPDTTRRGHAVGPDPRSIRPWAGALGLWKADRLPLDLAYRPTDRRLQSDILPPDMVVDMASRAQGHGDSGRCVSADLLNQTGWMFVNVKGVYMKWFRFVASWALAIIGLFTAAPGQAEDFMGSWYMSRGRANMEIENYKAAIEAFEKVVERDPNNREAMRSLGVAYEKQGLKDKAIEQFDRYLARWDDEPDIAFAQALSLEWSRYAYREKDMLKYYRMGLKRKNDPVMRLKYAAHLARSKDTSQ